MTYYNVHLVVILYGFLERDRVRIASKRIYHLGAFGVDLIHLMRSDSGRGSLLAASRCFVVSCQSRKSESLYFHVIFFFFFSFQKFSFLVHAIGDAAACTSLQQVSPLYLFHLFASNISKYFFNFKTKYSLSLSMIIPPPSRK
jgi:hypothetical protein